MCGAPSSRSFDHLVDEHEQGRRNVEAKRPGGLEIDHELEFGGLQDGQLSRLFALQNAAGIDAGLPIAICNARSISRACSSSSSSIWRRWRGLESGTKTDGPTASACWPSPLPS